MFSAKKNTSSTHSTPKYSSYIHTMRDDLEGNSGDTHFSEAPSETLKESEFNNGFDQKNLATENFKENNENPFATSPFLATQPIRPEKNPVAQSEKISPEPVIPDKIDSDSAQHVAVDSANKSAQKLNWYKITLASVSFCIIAVAGFAGYYFFMTRKPAPTPVEEIDSQIKTEEQITINPMLEKFSSTQPNYLSVNMSAISAEEIWKTINQTAAEIKETGSSSPFEFIITDANNNPVSFPIFAIASKIELSQEILQGLGENFSLFLKNENGVTKIALAIKTTDESLVKSSLLQQEGTLPQNLSILFPESIVPKTQGEFKTGVYGAISTRYLNFDQIGDFSIDYAITGGTLYFGTSKDSLRSAIDRYSQK